MNSFFVNIFTSRDLYHNLMNPVCEKYGITHTELDILLFLNNNPQLDTATDIVEKHRITKSSVSTAARVLQERGFITGNFMDGNHRSIHLKVCEAAKKIIDDGNAAQNRFLSVMTEGFSPEEKQNLRNYLERINRNISEYSDRLKSNKNY